MGFFRKKKDIDAPSSVLSESEIQRKLYGEFSSGSSYVVTGEREPLKESSVTSSLPKVSLPEEASDLFSVQKEALSEQKLSPRPPSLSQKSPDHSSRLVYGSEGKTVPFAVASFNSDPNIRFHYNRLRENRLAMFSNLFKEFSEKIGEQFKLFLCPRQAAVRRALYWAVAIVVIFILFLGVNALNSRREEAMRVRYKIPVESVPVKVLDTRAAVVPAESVVERAAAIPPEAFSLKPVPTVSEPYVIQVVTYPSSHDADLVVKTLKNSGFRAFVKESVRPSGRIFYMVLIGGFRTAAEAQSQLLKFRGHNIARPFQDSFVRTNRS